MQYKFLTPLDSAGRSAPEVIFGRLSEAIATGELQPGDRLPSEADLANAFGVAVMTLRRALETLREVGLIETKRGRFGGNFVSLNAAENFSHLSKTMSYSRKEVRELADWRRAVSGEACYLAAERGEQADFDAIREASLEFDRSISKHDAMRLADAKLHLLISSAARSGRLHREESSIQAELSRLLSSNPYSDPWRLNLEGLHSGLIVAIAERQSDLARRELIAHVESTFNWMVALLPE
ncbi:GntR family transcriptional regulator [Ensifer adhaerens]|uniref:FadR/GntR family transcriptional regulator n=1 Tax=Ensifer adhaerens TaxID=106592 RepID=UPI001CBCB80B|nr:GntR family transcriptional regulator [Ensifer adhaerens]MBZ7925022.1 GntR family transcriptional regulator [Ensifer adhaerens]UAX95781.1 GntR family transcriptional regulator [Ensifer adhaerens]UAY04878.1 GntR family transcriptional regulator [Ensifer adhaerens]UAY10310.1 GntR family transcriptional regulator [Ensifer adhaerens]